MSKVVGIAGLGSSSGRVIQDSIEPCGLVIDEEYMMRLSEELSMLTIHPNELSISHDELFNLLNAVESDVESSRSNEFLSGKKMDKILGRNKRK